LFSVGLTAAVSELGFLSFAKRDYERMQLLHKAERRGRKRQELLKLLFALRANSYNQAVKCR